MNVYLQKLFLVGALFLNIAFSPLETSHLFVFPGNKFTPILVALALSLLTKPVEEQPHLYRVLAFLNMVILVVNLAVVIFNSTLFK